MTHTPGPWQISGRDLDTGGARIRGANGPVVASVRDVDLAPDGGNVREANERLIAAAPDMLAVLYSLRGKRMLSLHGARQVELAIQLAETGCDGFVR